MNKPRKPQFVDLILGPLPVARINRTLQLDLVPGEVMLNENHQVHVIRKHPDDYGRLQPHLASVIAGPLYVGDDARNPDSFELIGRARVIGELMLIAVNLEPDDNGFYQIVSFYPVSDKKISGRLERGFLKHLRP